MSRDQSVAVAVGINGGQTTIALIDHCGQVRQRRVAKTLRGRPAGATLDPYLRAIDLLLMQAQIEGWQVCGIGVSVPGSLDCTSRRPLLVPLLPALNGFPLCDLLEARYHLPAQLHIDADAAILGEYRFGAGRDCRRLLYLTINAVVGAAFVIDGQLESSSQYTGHICHFPISASGGRCSCGKRGCINTLVSVDAIQRMVQRALRRGDETSLTQRLLDGEYFSPQLLAEEAVRGDSVAQQIYSEIGRWVGAAVARYVSLFEPHKLILGGGILSAGDLVLAPVRHISTMQSTSRICSLVDIVPACLGNDAMLIGCATSLLYANVL